MKEDKKVMKKVRGALATGSKRPSDLAGTLKLDEGKVLQAIRRLADRGEVTINSDWTVKVETPND